ncbi:MAG: PKD domain-containing protein [Candidatus Omnitrophica bacterium]|nr:PKD domain-containing protein [Candidatus Omnitrophota bacterium]
MKIIRTITKYKIIVGWGTIALLVALSRELSADTLYQNQDAANVLQTSLKCNEFTFDASRSRVPISPNLSYFWDFGDGTTSTEPIVIHTYQQSGDYEVYLTITDNSGFECTAASTSQKVRVNIPPHASFISLDQACVKKEITFDAGSSYSETQKKLDYSWHFGDGDTRRGFSQVNKIYTKGGDYRVRLTVDDKNGTPCSKQTAEKMIHINEPPAAEAGDDVIFQCFNGNEDVMVHFDASATTDANHDPLTYLWDFGDGNQGNGIKVSHCYDKVSNYDVRLIVSDNTNLGCGTGVDFVSVKLSRAPEARAGDDTIACVGEDIDFDGSRSFVHKKGTAFAQWFFGDGTSSKKLHAPHRYNQPGTYQATLTLENKLNAACPISRDTRSIIINSSPVPNIQNQASACVGREVFFDASSTVDAQGDDLIYYWNFGDGTALQAGSKISHTYEQGGHYRISVVVDDQKGTSCSTATAYANININTPPIANAGPNSSCCVNKEVLFSASASSDPDKDRLTYTWNFGDGNEKQGENVTHTYSEAGSYNVRLTVNDLKGSYCSQSTDGFTAVVREVPIPSIDIR